MTNNASLSTTVTLNNGVEMPVLGLGVFLSPPELTATAVRVAIAKGYRLIDTASAYKNERAVGQGLRASGIDRGQIFVTTKVFPSQYGFEQTLRAFDDSLARLGIAYLDLYLLHFGSDDIERLVKATQVVPTVNQVELHPFFTQQAIRKACRKHGIITEAWSPIGGVFQRNRKATASMGANGPLDHPTVTKLAGKYAKTPAQVVLRWHLQHGIVAIPKSVHAERIAENADVFDFRLTEEEMRRIDDLDTGVRAGSDPATFTRDSYHVNIDDQ